MKRTIKIPPRFYQDHKARDCGQSGVVVKRTKTYVIVELDQEAWDDLYSDADYYGADNSDGWFDDSGMRGIISSARATLRVMREHLEKEGKE